MTVTDQLLDRVHDLLATGGRFYLIAVAQNRPNDIVARLERDGLQAEVSLALAQLT